MGREDNAAVFEKRDFYYSIFKHHRKILSIILIATITSILGVYIWPKSYEVSAQFIVKTGRENVSVPTVMQQSSSIITSGITKEDINSEIEIIKSRSIIENAINKLGLDYIFPPLPVPDTLFEKIKFHAKKAVLSAKDSLINLFYYLDLMERQTKFEEAINKFNKKLSVSNVNNADIFEVRFRWDSKDKAVNILNTIIDLYLKRHSEVHSMKGTSSFFDNQLIDYKNRLNQSEKELRKFKKNTNITLILSEKQILLEQIGKANDELQTIRSRNRETLSIIDNIKKQIAMQTEKVELSSETERNPLIDSYKIRLTDMKTELNKLKVKYQEDNPLVKNLKEDIDRITDLIKEEERHVVGVVKSGENSTFKGLEDRLLMEENNAIANKIKENNAQQYSNKLQNNIDKLNNAELELERLDRQKKIDEEHYALYVKKFEEARISDVMDKARIVNVNLIDPPSTPLNPVWPKKLPTIAGTFAGSILTGIFFALFLEYLNPSIKTERDIEHYLMLPHLVTIPEYKEDNLLAYNFNVMITKGAEENYGSKR